MAHLANVPRKLNKNFNRDTIITNYNNAQQRLTRTDCFSWLWNICGTGKGDSVIVQEIVQELAKRLESDVHPAVRLEAFHIIHGLDKKFINSSLILNSLKSAKNDPDPNIAGGTFNFLFEHGQVDTNEFIDFIKNRAHGVVLPPVPPEPKASLNDRTKNRLQRAQTMRIGAINKLGKIGMKSEVSFARTESRIGK